jgi:hypothetical protein
MHISSLVNHNMLRYSDMIDNIISSRKSQTKLDLSSREKKQLVIDHMFSAIIRHLTDPMAEQEQVIFTVGTSHSLIPT